MLINNNFSNFIFAFLKFVPVQNCCDNHSITANKVIKAMGEKANFGIPSEQLLVRMGETEEYCLIEKAKIIKRYETRPEFEEFGNAKAEEILKKAQAKQRTQSYGTFSGQWLLIGWTLNQEHDNKNAVLVHVSGSDAFTGKQINFNDQNGELNEKLWKKTFRISVNTEGITYPVFKPSNANPKLFNDTAMKRDFKLRFDGDKALSGHYMSSSVFLSQFAWFAELIDPRCNTTLRSFVGLDKLSYPVSDRALKTYFDILHGEETIVHKNDVEECNLIAKRLDPKSTLKLVSVSTETLPPSFRCIDEIKQESTIAEFIDAKSPKYCGSFPQDCSTDKWLCLLNALFSFTNQQKDPNAFRTDLFTKEKCALWKCFEAQMPTSLWNYCTKNGIIPNSSDIVQLFLSKHCL